MNPYQNKDLRKLVESLSEEEIVRGNILQQKRNDEVYEKFITSLKKNECFMCGMHMNTFNESKQCFHWFTYPDRIKKKHFEKFLSKPLGYFRLDSYFRWLANSEKPIININDLKEETSHTSYIEATIKYKNIEWAFSIGHTDKEGHANSAAGNLPHYHLQMKVNDRIFLKFNDFHIQFTDGDLFDLEMLRQAGDKFEIGYEHGIGMGILEDPDKLKIIDDLMSIPADDTNAAYRRQTFIEAPEGGSISGELIQQAMEECQRTNRPFGKILQDLVIGGKVKTVITASDAVPKMT